jgi:DNA-binding NtrC family response regulator
VEVERKHIQQVLHETNWVLGGDEGAASRLGIPRTTLLYRMKKLGIPRQQCGAGGGERAFAPRAEAAFQAVGG